ncbi:AraC family transcriptional regulator [Paenibacillus sp. BSR1-1]|uniref:AraC family transcriptional regulator n=1 Tax=Paenibacillus sp. BSR1-1 TaxID=3020845 RepID=UPI0025B2427B|nr:AraC family transcriptional regulator [Paenibacillus sp. BSR1-1]MDN3019415.1 AraC family transcriptional regulator [Paenibacillus sp. BSR1-1]
MQKSFILLDSPRFMAASKFNSKNPMEFKRHTDADCTEIIFIEHGRSDFKFEANRFVGKEGDLIILNPSSKIEGKHNIDDPLKGISICFSNLHIKGNQKGFLIEPKVLPVIHLQEEKGEIQNYLNAILSEYDAKRAGYQDIISSILQTVVIKVTRLLKNGNHSSHSSLCLEVKKYIEENFRQELTLDDLANMVYVSPYHLAHVFKQEVGLPPIQYMIQCRIEEAKGLLEHSELSVREISSLIGYENANYFNLLFKKMTGKPPGKYRKMTTNI